MGRFITTPPEVGVPRGLPDYTAAAGNLPEGVTLPPLDVDPDGHVPEDAGVLAGLPHIPVEDFPSPHFPEDLPDDADDPFSHLPWL